MPLSRSAWKKPEYDYTAADYMADLDTQGVQYGVVAAASLFGTYNDYIIRTLRQNDRLRATAIIDPATDLYTLEAMKVDGITGVRLQWFMQDPLPDLKDDTYQHLFYRLRDLGMHVHLNIDGDRLVDTANEIIDTGVRFVIDHFGWHDPEPGLDAESYKGMLKLLEHDNAWVKISSGFRHPEEHNPDWELPVLYTQDLLKHFGTEKLFWGSDSPFIGHEHVASYAMALDRFNRCVPDAKTRSAICENGYRFYFGD